MSKNVEAGRAGRLRPTGPDRRPSDRRHGEDCPRCGARLVVIDVPGRGSTLTLHSCGRCDGRWWSQDGRQVQLDEVLGAVSASGRRRTA